MPFTNINFHHYIPFHITTSSHITSSLFIHLYKIFSIKSTHTFKKLKFKKKSYRLTIGERIKTERKLLNCRVVGAMVIGAAVCGRIPGLAKSQREQCRKAPHAMPAVGEGAELGLRECRHQFRHHRWNCSHVANDQVFGHVVVVGKDCPVTAACPLFIIP